MDSFKAIFRWPSIAFWLAIVFGASGVLASVLLFFTRSKSIPTFAEIVGSNFVFPVMRMFALITTPFLAVVSYKTVIFMNKTIKVSPKRERQNIKIMFYILSTVGTALPASLALLVFTRCAFFSVIFVVSFILFHLLTDLIYAICNDSMIRISWIVNLACFALIVVFAFGRFVSFITGSHFLVYQLSNFAIAVELMISFIKLMFVGIIVLGARFIDADVDMFKKEKQTIIDDNYGFA